LGGRYASSTANADGTASSKAEATTIAARAPREKSMKLLKPFNIRSTL